MKRVLTLVLAVLLALSMVAIASAEEKTNNEVSILWDGGGNGEFVNYAIEQMEAAGASVDIEYTPKAHETFQPMLVGGNPPDIVMVQFGFFNHFEAIQAGAFQAIDELLDVVVEGSDKTVGEIANPDIVNAVMVDGTHYLLSSNMNVGGMYYNKTMFDEHGWTVPTTWDEFIALCEEIKTTTDIAPIAFPGMYPYYFDCFFFPQVLALGNGTETLKDLNNMVEGFWKSEPATAAAERVQYMSEHGYFLENMIGLSHTETQMEFINGNVAMLCCGSWLENEMAGNWPDDFDLHFMVTPSAAATEDEHFVQLSGHLVCFPAAAKNKEWNKEFVANYYSEASAVRVAKECGVVITPAYVAQNEEIQASLPASVVETFTLTNENTGYYMLATKWYSEFNDQYQALMDQLVDGEITAADFCESMEANAQAVRDNPDIVKYAVG